MHNYALDLCPCLVQFMQALSEEERKKVLEESKKAKAELQQKTAIISGLNVSQFSEL